MPFEFHFQPSRDAVVALRPEAMPACSNARTKKACSPGTGCAIGGWTGDTLTADVCLVTPPHHVRVTIDAGRESFVFDDDGTWIRTIIDATRRPTRAGRASHSNVAWIQSQAVRSCRDIPAESLN